MQYLGGKFRIRRWIADVVAQYPGEFVWEPFCGGLNSAEAHYRPVLCSDSSAPLIALYRAVAGGWEPPREVSEAQYQTARGLPESDPMHGFCAFGCSFGGKYWGGYARGGGARNYAAGSSVALTRQVRRIVEGGGEFACGDFTRSQACALGAVIYCDPPYAGTTGYRVQFDRAAFVSVCLSWAQYCPVLVSEYEFPVGRIVAERRRNSELRHSGEAVERVYLIEP